MITRIEDVLAYRLGILSVHTPNPDLWPTDEAYCRELARDLAQEVMPVIDEERPDHYAGLGYVEHEPKISGVWRHADDMSHCSSYPDSFDWSWTEKPWNCTMHGKTLVCLKREEATT